VAEIELQSRSALIAGQLAGLSGSSLSATTATGGMTAEADDHLSAEGAGNPLQQVQLRPGSRALQSRDAWLLRAARRDFARRSTRWLATGRPEGRGETWFSEYDLTRI